MVVYLIDRDSLIALKYDIKINFCFINEIFKFFNAFEMKTFVNIKER